MTSAVKDPSKLSSKSKMNHVGQDRIEMQSEVLEGRCNVTNDPLHHEGIRAGDTRTKVSLSSHREKGWASNEEAQVSSKDRRVRRRKT